MLNILTATTLYPNTVQPRHGIFVEQRLLQLIRSGEASARVIAPVPWFPWTSERFGRYGRYAAVPRHERRHGLAVSHPRYPAIPKVGMHAAPGLLALALLPHFASLQKRIGAPFVLDGHVLYPDGVAFAIVARRLGIPYVLTARGSDVNWFCRYPGPRAMVRWAAIHSAKVVTVSRALQRALLEMGVPAEKTTVLSNGVDTEFFRTIDRVAARRQKAGYDGFTLLSVGNLIPLKGHELVIEAVARLAATRLVIVGEGPADNALRSLIRRRGIESKVTMLPNASQEDLLVHYNAADALVLASEREGMPNVILESLACGTPVIGTSVGGIPELITSPDAGVLVRERSPLGIVRAVEELQSRYPDRSLTRKHASNHAWRPTVEGLLKVFRDAVS